MHESGIDHGITFQCTNPASVIASPLSTRRSGAYRARCRSDPGAIRGRSGTDPSAAGGNRRQVKPMRPSLSSAPRPCRRSGSPPLWTTARDRRAIGRAIGRAGAATCGRGGLQFSASSTSPHTAMVAQNTTSDPKAATSRAK
ncbi:hypothetical protein SL003B_2092 [Polymorphum gilvum SL003B-26A1]|uniref:Uncharacterized protein n=1 Tax=Polymorphum gilvum (strain LMG 25793 / CGMCC 1.9160 / SL003B-26A1) TaxID=991905 RepID=F2IY13_POLGS|nr:hypothetical protein SL003B_2092 [Polymorphum gilvum SL003B-26A1]